MTTHTDNILMSDPTTGMPIGQEAADLIQQSAKWQFQGDVQIDGNIVTKKVIEHQFEETRIADNHLLLNDGYTTVSAQTAGFVANYLPIATTDTVDTGGFTAGVPATSNPTVITVGSATFAVGQFILITGANNTFNNGLYEVLSHVGTTLTIRGIGTVTTVEDFTEDDFETDTTVAGSITRINVSVMRAGTDGVWETAAGSTTGLSFTDVGAGGGNTLQQAYVAGNTITTSAPEGDVTVAGTEALVVTTTGGIDLNTQFDFDGTVFDVLMTSGGFSIDGVAASNVSVTGGALTLSTITSGDLVLNSAGDIDADAVNVLLDASAGVSIDAATSSNLTITGNSAGAEVLTVEVTNAGAGTGDLDINVDDAVTLDAASYSLDATAASNVSTTAANLTLSTITSGDLILSSAGDILVDGATISIDGSAASNVSTTSADLTLSTITSGQLLLTSAGDSVYTVPGASATAMELSDGTNVYLRVDSTDTSLDLPQFVNLPAGNGVGVERVTDAALVQGTLVRLVATTGNVDLTDADSGNLIDGILFGVSTGTFSATNTARLHTVSGALVPMLFTAAPAAADIGKTVWIGTTAGQAAIAPPAIGTNVVRTPIGVLASGDGIDTTPLVALQPSPHPLYVHPTVS
jgi:hypothetical protein